MKRILISGGAGFLGSNLCAKLVADGNKVFCLDNFYTGKISNLKNLIASENFSLINFDIENPIVRNDLISELINEGIDEIYNLACPASPECYQKSPTKTIKTNVIGMINMLELAKKHNARILQASTSEIYGDPEVHPQSESYRGNVNPIGIRACYDEGKRCAEALCFDYNREFNVRIKVVRIFNTYGPKMDPNDGRVVSNFILQAINNEDITIYGDGSQTRSFCYVDDMIEGIIKMMESEEGFTGPVNLGNPIEFTMIDLAKKILQITKSNSTISFKPLPLDDPTRRKPVIELAINKLEWRPKVILEEGLIKTIKYYTELI